MDYIQLYCQEQGATGYASYIEIDLYNTEPIKLTKSVQSLTDPTATTSTFSRTFRVPSTNANGQYFKAVFNVNTIDYNPSITADAYINVNGTYFIGGNVRLQNVFRNDATGKIEYDLLFLGETGNFGTIVAPKDLSTLNLSDYTHALNYTNIQNSWTYNLFGGDIVYPLAEWGYTYSSGAVAIPTQSTLARYDATVAPKGFTNSINPLALEQFKPAVRVKAIWDRIFQEAGFTYDSVFLGNLGALDGSDTFTKLYMISTNEASTIQTDSVAFEAQLTQSYSVSTGTGIFNQLVFTTEIFDDANAYNPLTSQYVIPFTGSPYTFSLYNFYGNGNPGPNYSTGLINLYLFVNGVQNQVRTAVPDFNGQFQDSNTGAYEINFSGAFTKGDIISFYITVSPFEYQDFEITNLNLGSVGPQIIDPSGLMPVQYKQIDLIKAVNDRFKLVWEPDRDDPTKFYIEPWVTWIKTGRELNWTDKLDEGQDISLKPLFFSQPRQIKYKDSEESDIFNLSYQQQYKETFGQLNTDSNIEQIKGERIISSLFASMPVAPIGNSTNFLIPKFSKLQGIQFQPIQVKPRLAYFNGLQLAPVTWYMEDDVAAPIPQVNFPAFSSFDRFPYNTFALDLNWTNPPQYWDTVNVGFSGRTARTAFTEFWQAWWNSVYDPYSRVMEATFALDVNDVQDLKFNDIIFIKDAWWFPITVKDFVLGAKSSVRVELLKLGNVGINIGGTGGTTTGTKYFLQQGLCYSASSTCEACCCEGLSNVTVYTDLPGLNESFAFFQDAAGTLPSPAGIYSDGTNTYLLGNVGQLLGIGNCSGCNCGPLGPTTFFPDVCLSETLCTVCCCTVPEAALYGNGSEVETSTQLWPTATGGLLTPGYWYGTTGGNAVQIGPDGNTVVQVGYCPGCNCNLLEDSKTVSGGTGSLSSCCVEGVTGTKGPATVFYNNTDFFAATEFYYDPDELFPVGATSATYISDAEYFHEVIGGTGVTAGICVPSSCPDRTYTVNYNYINIDPGVATEINTQYQISFNGGDNWFYAGDYFASGPGFNLTDTANYAPESSMRNVVTIPVGYTGNCEVSLSLDGDVVYSIPFSTPGTLTTESFDIDPGITGTDWVITWYP
jgi:hypothetical protein